MPRDPEEGGACVGSGTQERLAGGESSDLLLQEGVGQLGKRGERLRQCVELLGLERARGSGLLCDGKEVETPVWSWVGRARRGFEGSLGSLFFIFVISPGVLSLNNLGRNNN